MRNFRKNLGENKKTSTGIVGVFSWWGNCLGGRLTNRADTAGA